MNEEKKQKPHIKHFKRFAREWAMQFLFQFDIIDNSEINDALKNFINLLVAKDLDIEFPSDSKTHQKAIKATEDLVHGVIDNKTSIDDKISSFSAKWTLDRMNTVDRNIMRVATYEMLFCNNVPPIVSINEAVEIGKLFGTVNSAAFINGILNSMKNTLDRPAREAVKE